MRRRARRVLLLWWALRLDRSARSWAAEEQRLKDAGSDWWRHARHTAHRRAIAAEDCRRRASQ